MAGDSRVRAHMSLILSYKDFDDHGHDSCVREHLLLTTRVDVYSLSEDLDVQGVESCVGGGIAGTKRSG